MRIVQQVRTRKTQAASGFFALAATCLTAQAAAAAASAWHEEEGGRIRLMTAGSPDAAGALRGALEIVLKPGWKTYWRDPGTAGVPPTIDVAGSANVSAAVLGFPAPQRHDDGYGAWAGYAASVTLPVTFTLPEPNKPARVEASIFLGLCREICLPVSAHFSLDTAERGGTEAGSVAAAFAALPAPASERFGVAAEAVAGNVLRLAARLPAGSEAKPELFVAGENGFAFGTPVGERTATGWRFSVPLLDRPAERGVPVFFTLVAGSEAVSGTFAVP